MDVKTDLERQVISEANCRYVRKLVAQRGWTEHIERAGRVKFAALLGFDWSGYYSLAYAYGHNTPHLHGRRLGHFASAFADICEQAMSLLDLDKFFEDWDRGDAYEGTPTEHWYVA